MRKDLIWHPFTQAQISSSPIHIARGKGAYLYDSAGKEYLDLISSWWVNLHGHANEYISQAIYNQARQLEHIIFAGFMHDPAIVLCNILHDILPNKLERFFFSDNGSTAVEVALKMAYQYWWNIGERERTIFVSFSGGYHGDTFGAMSVGQKSGFHSIFQSLLFNVLSIPFPNTWENDHNIEHKEKAALDYFEYTLNIHKGKIAAFIMEPLVQGAGGMLICRPSFLRDIIDLARMHDVMIIFDEVMTGFGRTGTNFAYEQVSCIPDIICLSKGLTGGFMPLALTVATKKIYDAFLSDSFSHALAHGHSYTANPLGCAAAIASLELLLQSSTQKKIQHLIEVQKCCLRQLMLDLKGIIKEPRQSGTIIAFDLESVSNNYKYGNVLKEKLLEYGVVIRPLGNVIYTMPPYCIDDTVLINAYDKIKEAILDIRQE